MEFVSSRVYDGSHGVLLNVVILSLNEIEGHFVIGGSSSRHGYE